MKHHTRQIFPILFTALALSLSGCTAELTTSVEVYDPAARVNQLDSNKQIALQALLTNRKTNLSPVEVLNRIQHLEVIINNLSNSWDFSHSEISTAFANSTKTNVEIFSDNTNPFQKAKNEIDLIQTAFSENPTDEIGPILKCKVSANRFAVLLSDVYSAWKSLPPDQQMQLKSAVQNFLNSLPDSIKELVDAANALDANMDGVDYPDITEATYTNPLLNWALANDPDGWKTAAGAHADAQGTSEVVFIREKDFCFTIHSLANDPTQLLKYQLSMAESTLDVIAETVSRTSFIPTIKVNPGASQTLPADSAENGALVDLDSATIAGYKVLSKSRQDQITALLSDLDTQAAAYRAAQADYIAAQTAFENADIAGRQAAQKTLDDAKTKLATATSSLNKTINQAKVLLQSSPYPTPVYSASQLEQNNSNR